MSFYCSPRYSWTVCVQSSSYFYILFTFTLLNIFCPFSFSDQTKAKFVEDHLINILYSLAWISPIASEKKNHLKFVWGVNVNPSSGEAAILYLQSEQKYKLCRNNKWTFLPRLVGLTKWFQSRILKSKSSGIKTKATNMMTIIHMTNWIRWVTKYCFHNLELNKTNRYYLTRIISILLHGIL